MRIPFAVFGVLAAAGVASAATLRPSTIVYGAIRDSYGIWLSPDSAMVSAFLGTNEVARTTIRPQLSGANYRFEVNVCDPASASPADVTPGATVALRVRIGLDFQPLIGTNTFVVLGNGETVNRSLILGVDSDGDGLPDAWEWMVIANSGGLISNLSQVGPGRDLDGDGVPDDQEFFNGSFAFLPGDEPGALGPFRQLVPVLQDVRRNLVVGSNRGLDLVRIWLERRRARPHEVILVRVVHFQIGDIVCENGEHGPLAIEPRPAEHPPDGHLAPARKLLDDVIDEFIRYGL